MSIFTIKHEHEKSNRLQVGKRYTIDEYQLLFICDKSGEHIGIGEEAKIANLVPGREIAINAEHPTDGYIALYEDEYVHLPDAVTNKLSEVPDGTIDL